MLMIVAPHAGAWIETFGLSTDEIAQIRVAPHAGAWIETEQKKFEEALGKCRTPRGCVD